MSFQGPFHAGELEAQRRAGEAEEAAANAPMIGDRLMSGALRFIREQPMAVIASRDLEARLWASMLFGRPGFLDPDPGRKALTLHLQPELRDLHDPLWPNLERNLHNDRSDISKIGMLVIDLATRQRLRINGHLSTFSETTLRIEVEESFANCPKYIQRREVTVMPTQRNEVRTNEDCHGTELAARQQELLRRADTLFLATAHPERGLDASHRGGNPGFVEIVDERTLRIPDYAGNSMFNSIGNLLVDPRAGMIIPDFERCQTLQMTGHIEVEWKPPAHGDTGRFLVFHLNEQRLASLPAAVHTHFIDYSPWNPAAV